MTNIELTHKTKNMKITVWDVKEIKLKNDDLFITTTDNQEILYPARLFDINVEVI